MSHRSVLAAGALAVMLLAGARSAAADQGGTPNVSACVGQATAVLARQSQGAERLTESISLNVRLVQQLCAAGLSPAEVVQKVREAIGAPESTGWDIKGN